MPVSSVQVKPAEHFAILYVPRRKKKRYAENCVRIVSSSQQAIEEADSATSHYPARVYGPSKSSEGTRIYYLVRWLD
jgi:hypothetical protein